MSFLSWIPKSKQRSSQIFWFLIQADHLRHLCGKKCGTITWLRLLVCGSFCCLEILKWDNVAYNDDIKQFLRLSISHHGAFNSLFTEINFFNFLRQLECHWILMICSITVFSRSDKWSKTNDSSKMNNSKLHKISFWVKNVRLKLLPEK